jgi:hypothetical protein
MVERMFIHEEIENLLSSFSYLKSEIRRENSEWYARWKAGGFLIDSNIVSYYPNIEDYLTLDVDEEPEDEE